MIPRSPFQPGTVALAALLALHAGARAQDTATRDEPLALDRVVVTGTAVGGSKMKQSVSVSSLEADQIARQVPTSAAEILRSVPGVRSESSGGEGNANLTVRGVPISAGGARYVQFQEDGLPLLLFGDIAFGTADQFLRADFNLDHLEVVRGGSASTLATNSPGGIINFISKTGEEPGGAVGLTLGVMGGRQTRVDLDYGGKLGDRTRFHVGGFQRVGEGDRRTDFNAAHGGQIKANLTHDFGSGHVRVSLKALDDRTPSFMPVPVMLKNGQIEQIAGIDPRSAWFIGSGFNQDPVLAADGKMVSTNPRDGLHVRSTALGAEAEFRLGDGWKLSDRFRSTRNSGRFIALFPANNGDGATPATSSTFTATLFNTAIDDLGNTLNDLKLSRTFGGNDGRAVVSAGLFTGRQNVALTWYWNQYTVDMKNRGARTTFLGPGWTTWGGCCVRNFDVAYTHVAPYAALTWESGALTLDGSVRHDRQSANGWSREDNPATHAWDDGTRRKVDYRVSHTSYSLGGNFQFGKDLALFARASDGVAFSADRLLYGNPLDGSVPVAVNQVRQTEAGAKWRAGGLSLFATLFNARTSESNYEATTQTFTANRYRANGLELEAGYKAGAFKLGAGLTLTDAKITASNDAGTVGKKPRRQADWTLQLSPSLTLGALELGVAVIGTGRSFGDDANTITLPGYTVLNAFVGWTVGERTQVSFSVNNLTNALGYTEVEGDGHAARAVNGRTAKLALKYSF